MSIHTLIVPVTTTGSAGSAVGEATTPAVIGEVLDVYLDYHASAPATTDVTITFLERGDNLLAVADNKTDGRYHPRAKPVDNAGAAITNAHDRFFADGALKVAVAQCDALAPAVTAYIRVKVA